MTFMPVLRRLIDMPVLKWRVSLLTFVRDLCDCFTLTLCGPTPACQYEELEVPFYRLLASRSMS